MQPKPPDVRQSLSLKQTLPHDWPPGDGVGAGAGFDGFTKFQERLIGLDVGGDGESIVGGHLNCLAVVLESLASCAL